MWTLMEKLWRLVVNGTATRKWQPTATGEAAGGGNTAMFAVSNFPGTPMPKTPKFSSPTKTTTLS